MDHSPYATAVRPTTMLHLRSLQQTWGVDVTLASELNQHTGSFKFRAAYHLAANIPETLVITASSGNFGQALAYACQLLGKHCIVVMPTTSARVKVDAVKRYNAVVEMVDTRVTPRAQRVAELALEHPTAYVASAYDDPWVIAGNASLGRELAATEPAFDTVIAPIGGGGLAAGVLLGLREAGSNSRLVGAEPAAADDAARSLAAGRIVANEAEPATLADGARTLSLGRHNWEILRAGLAGIVLVPEVAIANAVRLLRDVAELRAEPTGALSLAALCVDLAQFRGQRVCCIVSGGNVDDDVYAAIVK